MKVQAESNEGKPAKRPRGRPSLREQKRDALIHGATVLFNSHGISAISIAEIAERLSLARASVYHYVKDRADLVYQCYIRSCESMADDLVVAASESNGLERLCQLVSLTLTPDRAPVAVLSEIHSLDGSIADVVLHAHAQNIRTLRRFIAMGVDDGSIRPCDDEVVAQSIFGMLSWSQLLSHWSSSARTAKLRANTARTIVELLSRGLAVDNDQPLEFATSVDVVRADPGDLFDRAQASQTKRERVLEVASRLFNRNGIDATSLDAIALELGVTKGVLYHYLQDKGDLVVKCYERAFDLQDRFIALSRRQGKNGLEEALFNAHLNIQAKASALSPLMPQPGFGSLPADDQRRFRRVASRQNKIVGDFLQQGIDDGLVHSCRAPLVTHVAAGAFGWIPKWRDPDDERSPIELANQICDVIFRGIAASPAAY